MDGWLRSIEELKLASLDRGTRVLGITGPLPGAGCSSVARLLADATQRTGTRTLRVDFAQTPDGFAALCLGPPHPWLAWMKVHEESGSPSDLRQLRRSLQASLSRSRLTRHVVSGVALTVSDMLAHVVEKANPKRIGIRVGLAGKSLQLEILHDGRSLADLGEQLVSHAAAEVISPRDAHLALALAARALPRWHYEAGSLHRLVGRCSLDGGEPDEALASPSEGCDLLVASPAAAHRAKLNSVEHVRSMLHEELADYEAIVVDLPPVLDGTEMRINPLAPIAACDGVYLVCMAGRVDRGSIERSMVLLAQSGARMLGVVVNEAQNPSLGAELAREARRLGRFAPGLSRWLERKALSVSFIN
jgi:hypothetical protein